MAFASTIEHRVSSGDGRWITIGTFTSSDGGTGGNIDTGLTHIENIMLQHTGNAVIADEPVVNETVTNAAPADGRAVTIVTTADKVGIWMATGIY